MFLQLVLKEKHHLSSTISKVKPKYQATLDRYLRWYDYINVEIRLGTFFIQEVVDDLLKLGEDPISILQGVRNNYQVCYPKQWHGLVINKIDPYVFFDKNIPIRRQAQCLQT